MPSVPRSIALLALLVPLAGCRTGTDDLLPAVFGLGEGVVSVYAPGTLPEVVAHPGDRLLGQSGTESGRCIFENQAGRRFRADCSEGYRP